MTHLPLVENFIAAFERLDRIDRVDAVADMAAFCIGYTQAQTETDSVETEKPITIKRACAVLAELVCCLEQGQERGN